MDEFTYEYAALPEILARTREKAGWEVYSRGERNGRSVAIVMRKPRRGVLGRFRKNHIYKVIVEV